MIMSFRGGYSYPTWESHKVIIRRFILCLWDCHSPRAGFAMTVVGVVGPGFCPEIASERTGSPTRPARWGEEPPPEQRSLAAHLRQSEPQGRGATRRTAGRSACLRPHSPYSKGYSGWYALTSCGGSSFPQKAGAFWGPHSSQ